MIELKNLKFGYSKRKLLFSDLNLEMSPGHIYGLLGKNGAGKTTLFKIISGLCFAKEGNVSTFGFNPCKREAKMLEKIYFLAEELYSPKLKIETFVNAYSPFYPKFNEKQFYELLKEMEFDQFDNLIDKCSLGQKKKVHLAFALATNTELLLMDEPTNGLDIPSKAIFRKIMSKSANDDKIIIISTHQVRDLHSLLDTVIIADNGKIILNQSIDEITKKLKFSLFQTEFLENEEIIYSEESIGGTYAILQNTDNQETKVDLELLFNAAIANKKLSEMFNAKNILS